MASKFDISEIDGDDESLDSMPPFSSSHAADRPAATAAGDKHKLQMSVSLAGDTQVSRQSTQQQPPPPPPSSSQQHSNSLYLHQNDFELFHRPQTPASKHSTQAPFTADSSQPQLQHAAQHATQQSPAGATDSASPASGANLGTLSGVYFPCVQNIFGVILFIRMVWIVGTAGVPSAFAIVFICCCVTLTTSISLSAIATNGIVPAGGSYFMISRSLGPECGGAVGTMFFLGTTVAGAMYITGAVEIILNYLAPSWGLFGDFQRDVSILYHNIRVYGTLLLLIVGLMVWIGVKFVSKLAPIALFCVLFSIASIYVGIFVNYQGRPDLTVCVVGDRLVSLRSLAFDAEPYASSVYTSPQHRLSGNNNNNNKSLDVAQLELARNKALCTYDKLKYVFCPSEQLIAAALQFNASSQKADNNMQLATSDEEPPQVDGASSSPSLSQLKRAPQAMRLSEIGDVIFAHPPSMSNCDEYFKQNKNRIRLERAVPGIASGILMQNLAQRFRTKGAIVGYDDSRSSPDDASRRFDYNYVFVDLTTSFTIFISIYFPSCTGILAGSNRSGDLADAQRSIPRGTIAAQLTTSFIYLSCVVLFGSTFNNLFIRDKFGESMGGQLAVTQIAWPYPYVILIGGLLSTLGASLQSLVGAPRVLQGIAKDEVIPIFKVFAQVSSRGEPENAIKFTLLLAWFAVLIGNLDFIAPILTLSLVMCYLFINLACTLHSIMQSPGWRPRFKHFHWSISLLGCLLCLFVMIVSSWVYFIAATFLAACIYRYIEFHGAEKEWGDGWSGLTLSAARYALLRLETSEPHTKNWRPQVLLFCKMKPQAELEPTPTAKRARQLEALEEGSACELRVAHPKLLTFAAQLKAGKGLTLVSSIVEGDYKQLASVGESAKAVLMAAMLDERVKGFADVVIAPSIGDGLVYQVQTAGLGGLKHNTVIVGWPEHWARRLPSANKPQAAKSSAADGVACASAETTAKTAGADASSPQHSAAAAGKSTTRALLFIELMRTVQVSHNALLVVKGVDQWPETCDKLGGFIDVWWIVNDGGLLMLLPHLLRQHRTWRACQLRVFTIAQPHDDAEQMRRDLRKFLYHLRIEVSEVNIVTVNNSEISSYAYERTLIMEHRAEILKRLNANRRQSILLEQADGRLLRIRKPSTSDFEDAISFLAIQASASSDALPMIEMRKDSSDSSHSPARTPTAGNDGRHVQKLASVRPDEANVRRMHTALTLNDAILRQSRAAKLVIINLPDAPTETSPGAANNYMEFVETITNKLERVLLVQNEGREVITIQS